MASYATCLQCACANGVFYTTASSDWVSRSRGETVGVDGAVRTVCLAGLVGVVGGYFGEMVLLVGVGWLVLRLCFGLFLLRGSWSGVGSLYLISTLWPGS